MPDPHTIKCVDCGQPYETRRPNTRYCAVCRLYRDLVYLGSRTKVCLDCEERFAPLAVKDLLCGKCDFIRSKNYADGECALCHGNTSPLLHSDVAVCLVCAREPKRRELLLRAVAKKRSARREAA